MAVEAWNATRGDGGVKEDEEENEKRRAAASVSLRKVRGQQVH